MKSTNSFHEYPKPSKNQRNHRTGLFPQQKRVNHKENYDSSRKPPNNSQKKFTNVLVSRRDNFFEQIKTKTSVRNGEYFNYEPFWLNIWIFEVAECSFSSFAVYQSLTINFKNARLYSQYENVALGNSAGGNKWASFFIVTSRMEEN